MVFKRRNKQGWLEWLGSLVWPKGGWGRAIRYLNHRLFRLPDPPHRIARGIFVGVFITFTPFFGLHFVLSAILAWILRGNIVAALLATFVGNPPTFVLIAAVSLETGHWLLGRPPPGEVDEGMFELFWHAIQSFFWNIYAVFTGQPVEWGPLVQFWHEVFFPYMIGGLIPGVICGLAAYYFSLPFIQAYQNRRSGRIKAKLAEMKEKAAAKKAAKKPE
ncbi:DUF2062 domain-containing protein [Roseovarius sp. SCSIO 43702]|uniref:DUF2062 domain-containing protein n=1 Tax=Roseovarius sp. SCSIO 43702 TaxID=2823043 RepID=UPI001C738440|nr:DUF2062 domain-containing protein [Roseovarius sp. SCSIO 43702]QYX58272.1 DUF2062 domain-containing protein [Roseovarius sp. SCSIO 43702]